MLFTADEIGALVGSYGWPFIRIAAMIGVMPVLSSSFVPTRARLMVALAVTAVVAPIIPPVPEIDAISIRGFLVIIQQVLIGVLSGFIFHLVFNAFMIGGQVIAMQMGLGFSMMVDPINGEQAPVMSMFFVLMVTLFFLLLDGHLAMIVMITDSFRSIPIADTGISYDAFWVITQWASDMFVGGVLVSLPAVTALLLVNMALGVMSRAAPQLNIFAVGFAVTIIAGFYVLLLSLPVALTQFQELMTSAFITIKSILHLL